MSLRVGLGSDLHRLEPGEGLRLGGVDIPCNLRSVAHSDGDAVLHAVTDAILGALGGPDIGDLFPDTSEENRGRDSAEFLREAIQRMRDAGYKVGNLDITVHLQSPHLGSHKETMVKTIARLCGCADQAVAVKAKSSEGVGIVGRQEAIFAQAVVLLTK